MRAGRLEVRADIAGNVDERSVAGIPKQAVRFAVRVLLEGLDSIVDVRVGREQILPAVVVEVGHDRAPPAASERRASEAAWCRLIEELPAAIVPEERKRLARQRRDVKVGPAVVVVVA